MTLGRERNIRNFTKNLFVGKTRKFRLLKIFRFADARPSVLINSVNNYFACANCWKFVENVVILGFIIFFSARYFCIAVYTSSAVFFARNEVKLCFSVISIDIYDHFAVFESNLMKSI